MSKSTSATAPESSPPASTSFPAEMVGCHVSLFIPHREGNITQVERKEDREPRVSLIKFEGAGGIDPGKLCHLETAGGLKFQGFVNVDETCKATVLVQEDAVWSCLYCTDMGVPTPPFSSSIKGMAVRFSEPDPQIIEATILKVEKLPSFSRVLLEVTGLPPYSARIGDRIVLRSVQNTWEATVMYFGDHNSRLDSFFGSLENRILIHVLDDHVPQGPKCLPHAKIVVRPAQSGPANIVFGRAVAMSSIYRTSKVQISLLSRRNTCE